MESIKFVFDISQQREFWFLLASDLHIFNKDFDEKTFKADFDEAIAKKARIYINGDVMDLIVPGDPRFSGSKKAYQNANFLQAQIEDAAKILKPYVNNIDVIGVGNHETAAMKFYHIDPVHFLIYRLNEYRDVKRFGLIRPGGYEGAIWQHFCHKNRNQTFSYDIFYNHGQGAKAEVTKGMIDINRRFASWMCDLVWLGHKHTKILDMGGGFIYRDKSGKIQHKKRVGIITGCYLLPIVESDSRSSGYEYRFSDVRTRTLQAKGGVFLRHEIINDKLRTIFETR